MLMTAYSTGMRRAEMCQLKVEDIDSDRMLIHIRQGKGRRDRDVPLSPKLLETLREYWRWMKPKTYLFPGTVNGSRADKPITAKMLWAACREAAQRAGIYQARTPAFTEAQFRHTPSGRRRRSAHRAGAARTRRPQAHFHLPASLRAPSHARPARRSTTRNCRAWTR